MAKKPQKRPASNAGRSANTKAGLKKQIKNSGVSLPLVRDAKGRARSMSVKELKEVKQSIAIMKKAKGKIKGYEKDITSLHKQTAEYQRKNKSPKITGKQVKSIHGVMPKITKKEGYGYTQAGSAGNFIFGEKHLKRTLIVRRNGRDTVIDTPAKELEIIRAIKGARSKYRKVLRERAKKGGIKISDVMFIATKREGKNTIIDIDAIEYGGLDSNEIRTGGLI